MTESHDKGEFYDTGWRPSGDTHRDEDGRPHDHPGLQKDVVLGVRASRALAMHELLLEKDVIGPAEVDEVTSSIGRRMPTNGASLVAKAWTDPEFRTRLLEHPKETVVESGFPNRQHVPCASCPNRQDRSIGGTPVRAQAAPGRISPILRRT